MSREDYLGEFEHLVLVAILQVGADAYGVPSRDLIEERAQRSVSFGAAYSTLRRMERKGYVTSSAGAPEPVRGGRAKKFFAVTTSGRDAVLQSRRRVESMPGGLELTLRRGSKHGGPRPARTGRRPLAPRAVQPGRGAALLRHARAD